MKIKKKKPQLLLQFFILCRHRLIFPGRFQPSIVSTDELNYRVRDGNGWTLIAKNTDYACAYYALVLISEAIIYDCLGFVNTFLQIFSIFFIGTGKLCGFCAVCMVKGEQVPIIWCLFIAVCTECEADIYSHTRKSLQEVGCGSIKIAKRFLRQSRRLCRKANAVRLWSRPPLT